VGELDSTLQASLERAKSQLLGGLSRSLRGNFEHVAVLAPASVTRAMRAPTTFAVRSSRLVMHQNIGRGAVQRYILCMPAENPVGAEARGKRRIWKAAEQQRFARVVALFDDHDIIRAARQFSKRNARHGACAQVLHRFDSCSQLEWVDLKSRPPVMCWSAIHAPPSETPLRDSDSKTLSFSERQASSSIFYIMTAKDGSLIRGLWSSSYTDHAVGRLIERCPGADISASIREAHERLLRLPDRTIGQVVKAPGFFVPAGRGFWWMNAKMMKSMDHGRWVLFIRAQTWVDRDMIRPDQLAVMQDLLTLQPGDRTLGMTLLHPLALRGLGSYLVSEEKPAGT
jgi:hypothetical protein